MFRSTNTPSKDVFCHRQLLLAMPVGDLLKRPLKLLISLYQKILSPLLGPRCRFYPSCSVYAKECLDLYPWHVALYKSCRRLLSCHPFHPGGVDLP